jgi:ABC-type multidrug transport system fused ATPase/permease subunit
MKKPSDATKLVLKKSRKYIFLRGVCSLIYRGIAMITPILFSKAVDFVTAGDYKSAIFISVAGIIAVAIFRMFDVICTYAWHKMYNSLFDNYTRLGVNKVFDNSMYSLSRFNIGEFLNMMSTDINVMSDFYCNLIMRLIRIFEVLIIFVYFFIIDLYIGIAGIIMGIISISVILLSSKKIEELNKVKLNLYDDRNTIVNEFLLSIREIKAFNIFNPMKNRIDESTQEYSKSFLRQRVGEDIFKFSVVGLIEVCRWGMFIYGIYLISIGKMEMGSLLIIYNYFTQLVDGFSEFATINIGIRQLKVSQDRFYQLIIYSHEKLLLEKKYTFKNLDIKFKDVLYGDREKPKLKNVSFDIKGDSINAIVGQVDSGKYGVVDLLLKLNKQHEGTISIGGVDISKIDFDYYYNLVSCIDIDDNFLNISIKDNLSLINDNFENIVYVCKKLKIHEDISQLKYGYDTILNSNDDDLKPNTKIMLNIARILLKNTKIMIFDDIFSSLNNDNRKIVLDLLNDMKSNHTIIIVDNNVSVLELSDNIVLLNDSEVVDSGMYSEISKNKIYKSLDE